VTSTGSDTSTARARRRRVCSSQPDWLAALNAEAMLAKAAMVVTGGMVIVGRRHDADTHPDLQRDVVLLGATWREVLGDDNWVVPGEEAIAQRWFGSVAPAMRDRIGDVVVAARGTAAIVCTGAEPAA
jgi:hypothetical protein